MKMCAKQKRRKSSYFYIQDFFEYLVRQKKPAPYIIFNNNVGGWFYIICHNNAGGWFFLSHRVELL